MVELVGDETPTAVLLTDEELGGHAHIVEEGGVDVVLTHETQRLDGDAGRVHRDDDDRDALVLLGVRIGADGEPAVVGATGEGGPHLLAVDDVLVTVAHGAGLERGEIGAGLRLGVADAEVDVTGEDRREEELLLPLGAVVHDGRAHGVEREHGDRRTGPHRLVEEDELVDRTAFLAAVGLGPTDAGPAVGAHLLPDILRGLPDAVRVREPLDDLVGEQRVVIAPKL